jgi:hypothetical protein
VQCSDGVGSADGLEHAAGEDFVDPEGIGEGLRALGLARDCVHQGREGAQEIITRADDADFKCGGDRGLGNGRGHGKGKDRPGELIEYSRRVRKSKKILGSFRETS